MVCIRRPFHILRHFREVHLFCESLSVAFIMAAPSDKFVLRTNETIPDFLVRYGLEPAMGRLYKFGYDKLERFNVPPQQIIDSIRPDAKGAQTVRILCQMWRDKHGISEMNTDTCSVL